jgi:tRNA modification GTPase
LASSGNAHSSEQHTLLEDTIVAVATAGGAAGLAVVRVSGAGAVEVADAVFRGRGALAGAASHTLHHGWVVDAAGERVDEVVAALFRAPRSYTREDVVELSCHGGALPAERVLSALIAAGARMARPGEFTLRAFVNGRVDLAQAEAVADLIRAETDAARALAVSQLSGALSREVRAISEQVLELLAEVEARVDFAEDVGGVEVPPHVLDALDRCGARLAGLLSGALYARAVREGLRVPIVGRPNVGKSSLFNALLGEERAIVTAVPGTTRDRVSEPLEVAGVRLTLTDTAGMRETSEPVEAIGVLRATEALESSALAVWVLDGSVAPGDEDARVAERLRGKRVLVAINKRDLGVRDDARRVAAQVLGGTSAHAIEVSATSGEGIADLRAALAAMLGASSTAKRGAAAWGAVAANPRHADALDRARRALERARAVGREGHAGEIVALELREARAALGEVTGETVDADLLDRIFGRFCIGK